MFIHLLKTDKSEELPILGEILKWEGGLMKLQLHKNTQELLFGEEFNCYYLEWVFTSKIIKSSEEYLYLLVLPSSASKHTFEKFLKHHGKVNRRKNPRVKADIKAIMIDAASRKNERKQLHIQILVNIRDVSINGIGFSSSQELNVDNIFEIKSLSLDLPIKAVITIANRRKKEQTFYYGAKINYLSEKDYFTLKKYVFIHQLEDNIKETTK